MPKKRNRILISVALTILIIISLMAVTAVIIKLQTESFLQQLAPNLSKILNQNVAIERLRYDWDGLDINIDIEQLLVKDLTTDIPVFMLGHVYGKLSPIGSMLSLNLRFKSLTVDNPVIYAKWREGHNLSVVGLLGQAVAGSTDPTPVINFLLGQKSLKINNAKLTLQVDENEIIPLDRINMQIVEQSYNDTSLAATGHLISNDDAEFKLNGKYLNKTILELNTKIEFVEVDKISALFPNSLPQMRGLLLNTIAGLRINKGIIEKFHTNISLDNISLANNLNFKDGKLIIDYNLLAKKGELKLFDLKVKDLNNSAHQLHIKNITSMLKVSKNLIESDKIKGKIDDFELLAKARLGHDKNGINYLITLAEFNNLNIQDAKKWLSPNFLPKKTYDWLISALQGGKIKRLYAKIDNEDKIIETDFEDTTLNYATKWPAITNLNTTLSYNNGILSFNQSNATMLGVTLNVDNAIFSNIGSDKFKRLRIHGQVDTKLAYGVSYLNATPLKESIGSKLELFEPTGNMALDLNLDLVFEDKEPVVLVNGIMSIFDSKINIPDTSLSLNKINGTFRFNNYGTFVNDLSLELFDKVTVANLNLDKNANDNFNFNLTTAISVDNLLELIPDIDPNKIKGEALFKASLDVPWSSKVEQNILTLNSDLIGLSLDYPFPINKLKEDKDAIEIKYFFSGNKPDIIKTKFRGYNLDYYPDNKLIDIEGDLLSGKVTFLSNNISMDLLKLDLTKAELNKNSLANEFKKIEKLAAFDIKCAKLLTSKGEFEDLSLNLVPRQYGYQIVNFKTDSKHFNLQTTGKWEFIDKELLEINGILKSSNLSLALQSMDIQTNLTSASGEITFKNTVYGKISDFNINNIKSIARLDLYNGSIKDINPGLGRILGLLSIESIKRRLQLDFEDVFSSGLAFDRLYGDFKLNKGLLTTNNLNIEVPSAKIALAGNTYLPENSLDLSLLIIPQIGASLPIVSAVAGGNPTLGALVWLFDKTSGLKISEIAKLEYKVTGTLDEPEIKEL